LPLFTKPENLAVIYELGAGVEKNEERARQFHLKACEAGLSSACNPPAR
jgi:TPR repeat protein